MQTIIKPERWLKIDFKELWHFRELFYIFAWRDVMVRYKQTAIGIVWAILQPFIMMVVFSVFFGKVAGIDSGDIPYPIFSYMGLLYWNYFSNALNGASASLVSNQAMVQKIYFPRLIVPLSGIFVFLVDFVFAAVVLGGLMIYYHIPPTFLGIAMVIPSLLISTIAAAGLGLFFAAVNVKFRDVRYALPFFIQLLIFVTPVIYPTGVLGKYEWLWFLNPMSGVISTMRTAMLGTGDINWVLYGGAAAVSVFLLVLGVVYFKKTERYFADIV